jgi:uncharacterized Tic20 family protein
VARKVMRDARKSDSFKKKEAQMELLFLVYVLGSLFICGFFILWPVLIWSHLREQTRLLQRLVVIKESEQSGRPVSTV